jgi:hypothetical protein
MSNLWTKLYAAKRRATDRALLASMEREIAQAEKAAARAGERPWNPETAPGHQITKEERERISRAFGRPA